VRSSNINIIISYITLRFCDMHTSNSNFYFSQQEEEATEEDEDEKEITQWEAICWLFMLTIWISILSGYLVDAIQVQKSLLTITFLCSLPFVRNN
jgi:Ca2+:H+ antiporter